MSKILIEIPENNVEERCYIINILLNEFLSLDYEIKCGENEHYVLFLPNDNILVIEDHFFNKYPNKKDYLCFDNIPKQVVFSSNKFLALIILSFPKISENNFSSSLEKSKSIIKDNVCNSCLIV